jgi:uncharacterized protein (TIGR02391 family)
MREMLRKTTPEEIASLPERELERALLNAMAERAADKMGGRVNRHLLAAEVIQQFRMSNPNRSVHQGRPVEEQIERNFRIAVQGLEEKRLIEPAPGMQGAEGDIRLTAEGIEAANEPLNFDIVRARSMLQPEMLHPKLRGKPYDDFARGHPTSAIQEAYKIVEIEVKAAAPQLQHITSGVQLVEQAFEPTKGPLTDRAESDNMRKALPRLFAGAMGRFRNPSTHTHRLFPDLGEAIEELMLASRLLRFLDEPARK